MRTISTLVIAAAMTIGMFGVTGCEQEDTTPVDTATDTMGDAADSAGDTMSDAADSAGDAASDAADSATDAADDAATPTTAPTAE